MNVQGRKKRLKGRYQTWNKKNSAHREGSGKELKKEVQRDSCAQKAQPDFIDLFLHYLFVLKKNWTIFKACLCLWADTSFALALLSPPANQ